MRNNSRFQRGSGVYTCNCCKKQTRETGYGESGSKLCADCFECAGWFNTCLDNSEDTDEFKQGVRMQQKHIAVSGCANCQKDLDSVMPKGVA